MPETIPTTSRATAGILPPEQVAEMEAQDFIDSLPRGITSSALLAMLQLRMNGQDQAIAVYAEGIKANTDRGDEVLGIMQELLVLKSEGDAAGPEGNRGNMWASEHGATAAAGGSAAEVDARFTAYLEDLTQRARDAGIEVTISLRCDPPPGETTPRVWADLSALSSNIDQAKQQLQEINSGSEMEMIRLQDVMQQRSSGVQLFTNLLKQLSDSQMAVIRNISG